ncbi:MAG TPA: hypothetical protein VF762_01635 [Blastocatellia bacterium]|jgi:hypothetical protein
MIDSFNKYRNAAPSLPAEVLLYIQEGGFKKAIGRKYESKKGMTDCALIVGFL